MNFKKLWSAVILLFFLSACIIPFEKIIGEEQAEPADSGIKSVIEKVFSLKDSEEKGVAAVSADPFYAADLALFSGDVDKALEEYQNAFSKVGENEQARALYGLGRAYALGKEYFPAIDAFNRVLGQYEETEYTAYAYYQLGEVYEEIGELQQAINAFSRFIQLRPGIIEPQVHKRVGDIAMQAGDYNQAIFSYQSALSSDPEYLPNAVNIKIGQAYSGLEDYTTAIQYFDNVYAMAEDDFTRSTANLLAGQAYLELEMNEDAYRHFLDSVIKYPKAYDSFTALTILVNDGYPVDNFLRGVVDYYAGSYPAAIRAFERYLDSQPDNNDGTAYYFLGLSHYFAGNPLSAIAAYQTVIDEFPANAYWTAAWDEKAYVQWVVLNEYTNGAETLVSFANAAPNSPDAPGFLFEGGRIFERSGKLEEAALIWQRLMNEYPSNLLSYRGLFLAGISYYRLGRFEEALSVFQRALVLGTAPDEKAKSYLWIGKTHQQLGNDEARIQAWQQGELADPTDYYSIRCSELLQGIEPFKVENDYDLGYDLALEKPEADDWLRATFSIPDEVDINNLAELETEPEIQRIAEYAALGMYSSAVKDAENIRQKYQTDVINSYRLLNFFLQQNLYQPSIYTARNILNMAGLNDLSSLTAPIYFTHIRFGAYFRELAAEAANEYDVPLLLLLSLIRQESLFNPFIFSNVGASGLAQIMPATGQENADLLNWPTDYEQSDLQRGEVSITLGAFYLDRISTYLGGNLQAALAGYNAGPGNAEAWLALADGDPDLFLEVIRAQETQNYLMQITEFLNIYKLVYHRIQ